MTNSHQFFTENHIVDPFFLVEDAFAGFPHIEIGGKNNVLISFSYKKVLCELSI